MKPFELPGYEIKEKIGEGGMATVWKARQISLDRPVAIKVLSKQSVPDHEAMLRFRQEAQSAAKINHHGIVQVYDAGELEGLPYFVMEYIEGCSVGDLLERKGKFSEKNALLIAEGIALGLGYAWEKAGIIHCDVKPDNIMVERDGSVKVADLGLARLVGPRTVHEQGNLIIGTPNYSSPEQSKGVPDLDCRSDIYSLGAMLYHMVTGVLPFAGSEGSAAMDKHITDHLDDPLDLNPEISQGLAWLIEKLMIKERSLRPQTWVSVIYDLKEVRNGGFPPNLPERGQSTVLRGSQRNSTPAETQRVDIPERETSDPTGGVRRKIVISKDDFEQVRATTHRSPLDPDRALVGLLMLALLAFGAYEGMGWLVRRHRTDDVKPAPSGLPPHSSITNVSALSKPLSISRSTSVVAAADVASEAEPEIAVIPEQPAPPPPTPANEGPIKWDNPAFVEGANLFNSALTAYDLYRKDKTNAAMLKKAEADCRRAVNLFDSCKDLAPQGVDIQLLIAQCYHMLADIRHSMLLDPTSPAGFAAPIPAPSPAMTTPTAGPAPTLPVAETNAAPRNDKAPGMTLSPLWNSKLTGSDIMWGDLYELLSPYGKAQVDLTGDPTVTIYGPVTYLMPVKEAARLLGLTLSPSRLIDCTGFPAHSFYFYAVNGAYEGGFNQLLLIVDAADRVVGVQLVNDHPDALWLDPMIFTDTWHTHNFVQSRVKGSKKWKIAYRVRYMEKTLTIDSELVAYDERAMGQIGKSKEHVSLVLPHQVVNLILYRIEKGK